MATAEELKSLKESWKYDPIWDLEETDGFEEHREELRNYRLEWESIWDNRRNEELVEKGKKMGIPDNLDLVRYIEGLEFKIEQLENKLYKE